MDFLLAQLSAAIGSFVLKKYTYARIVYKSAPHNKCITRARLSQPFDSQPGAERRNQWHFARSPRCFLGWCGDACTERHYYTAGLGAQEEELRSVGALVKLISAMMVNEAPCITYKYGCPVLVIARARKSLSLSFWWPDAMCEYTLFGRLLLMAAESQYRWFVRVSEVHFIYLESFFRESRLEKWVW